MEAKKIRDELARAAAKSLGKPDAASLAQQLAVHDDQLDKLKLKLAKVRSTLQQLVSQRDLLNARLKAIGAQLKSDGNISSRRFPRRKLILAASTATVLIVAIVITSQFFRRDTEKSASPEMYTVDLDQAHGFGGALRDSGNAIAVDAAGNVYTTGYFNATADFDPGDGVFNLTSVGDSDIFVSKLDNTGNLVWAKRMGGVNADDGLGLSLDRT